MTEDFLFRHCAKHFALFNPYNNFVKQASIIKTYSYYNHFAEREAKAWKNKVIRPVVYCGW